MFVAAPVEALVKAQLCTAVLVTFFHGDAEDVALTTNQNYVRDFPVAYDILFENISDQVRPSHSRPPLLLPLSLLFR